MVQDKSEPNKHVCLFASVPGEHRIYVTQLQDHMQSYPTPGLGETAELLRSCLSRPLASSPVLPAASSLLSLP